MRLKERYKKIIEYFLINKPDAETELAYNDPFELMVSVILSAQCTDKRVNMITPALFKVYPDAVSMAKADPMEIFKYIRSCSYPNNKAKHLSGMSRMLVEKFNCKVPSETAELLTMPGVGRKTANVISSVVFNKPVMAVDTHVFRVSQRIGLVKNAMSPLDAEIQLTKNIPEKYISLAHHWLLLHGRYICKARKPLCKECGINNFCKFYTDKKESKSQ
jgi:endonuclease III